MKNWPESDLEGGLKSLRGERKCRLAGHRERACEGLAGFDHDERG
jgi:hypothetical protein